MSSTLICSSRAVRREMRCVRLGFVTLCCPSFSELLSCTICWASSSQRRRSSVGWSAGTMPWSGASCTDTFVIHFSNIFSHWLGDDMLEISEQGMKSLRWAHFPVFIRGKNQWRDWSVSVDLPRSRTAELHEAPCWDLYSAVQAQALW